MKTRQSLSSIVACALCILSHWSWTSSGTLPVALGFQNGPQALTEASRRGSKIFCQKNQNRNSRRATQTNESIDECFIERRNQSPSRRNFLSESALLAGTSLLSLSSKANAASTGSYKTAPRPTAYRVDSTIPPTLQALSTAPQQTTVLVNLGQGYGTDKKALVVDTVNLNNVLNKAVFGTATSLSRNLGLSSDDTTGKGLASFVCFGMPSVEDNAPSLNLLSSLIQEITSKRKSSQKDPTAIGLYFCPYSSQPVLDDYLEGRCDLTTLQEKLTQASVPQYLVRDYIPILQYAKERKFDLIAMAIENDDLQTVRKKGIQFIDPDRRAEYVLDPQGFIDQTQDPRYQMYTDRSLFKDYTPVQSNAKDSEGNFFAERILVHEAAASAVVRFTSSRPNALVLFPAPVADLRFMQGINGRIPRIAAKASPDENTRITENAVTTILLDPSAQDTLSKSRYLRLEIGTGPDSLAYQTKVADYLWFSSTPPVNLLPRLMG